MTGNSNTPFTTEDDCIVNAPTTLATESASRLVTTEETWSSRLIRSIADQIRRHRRKREWSAQRLSQGALW